MGSEPFLSLTFYNVKCFHHMLTCFTLTYYSHLSCCRWNQMQKLHDNMGTFRVKPPIPNHVYIRSCQQWTPWYLIKDKGRLKFYWFCGTKLGLINPNWMEHYHQPLKLKRWQKFSNWWWMWKRLCRFCLLLFFDLFVASYFWQQCNCDLCFWQCLAFILCLVAFDKVISEWVWVANALVLGGCALRGPNICCMLRTKQMWNG